MLDTKEPKEPLTLGAIHLRLKDCHATASIIEALIMEISSVYPSSDEEINKLDAESKELLLVPEIYNSADELCARLIHISRSLEKIKAWVNP
ncbi:hypothetical protein KKH23_08940 [Patescibacteria group bacterium]|nr:hypothetical protein [Patescibacteria group bacterium]